MRVPFLDLLRQYQELETELNAAILTTLRRGVYILGEEVAAFEREWAVACGVQACAGVGNGTDAIVLALLASGAIEPGRGDEVITSPLTAAYTGLAIRQAGAVPVFADIDPYTYTLDPSAAEAVITARTKVLLPVHLYGQMANMPELCNIARRRGLVVIEDCAQAHGARLHGAKAGSYGHAATFSFYPTKNLGAFGDGGAVVSNDEALIERVKVLRQGGHPNAVLGTTVGMNSRLDELHAAMLRVKLRHLDEWTARRRQIADIYDSAFVERTDLALPINFEQGHVFHLYVVQHEQRERLRAHLAARGVETLVHYPYLLHQQPLFQRPEQPPLPTAETAVRYIFSLPLNAQMQQAEVNAVIEAVHSFFAS
jgi:dTDP-4-amino-4,6-dideoxygalactose transaminase